jgi:flavodoxin
MKKLFIYYSLTGNGELIANTLRDYYVDVRRIEAKKSLPKFFPLRIFVGGYKAMKNQKDELLPYDKDISQYDEIIIGSPIWNGRLACPINTLLSELDLTNKDITFIFYSGSGDSHEAQQTVKKMFEDVSIINMREPMKNKKELEKLSRYE